MSNKEEVLTGTIKTFNYSSGQGVINGPDEVQYFFNYLEIDNKVWTLAPGTNVRFKLRYVHDIPIAKNVTILEGH